jgi:cell division protein FtsW
MPSIQKLSRAQRREGQRRVQEAEREKRRVIGTGHSVPAPSVSDAEIEHSAGTVQKVHRFSFLTNPVFCFICFISSVILLTLIGLVMVFSSSTVDQVAQSRSPFSIVIQQIIYALFGFGVAIGANFIPVKLYRRFSGAFLCLAFVLQILTVTKLGRSSGGNAGWIQLGPISFQPAEVVKLALCIWMPFAILLSQKRGEGAVKAYVAAAVGFALAIGLVMLGKDMGTALIVGAIGLVALFCGGISCKFFFSTTLPAAGLVALYFLLGSSNRMSRVKAMFSQCSAASDASTICYQTNHGRFAISSGGLFGVGLGASKEKWNYLPEAHNDFIFAIICEELGFVGAIIVLLLFIMMCWSLVVIARSMAHQPYERLVIICIATWIIVQALINIAVVLGLLPVIGVPLPFVSAGGTALVMCLVASGVAVRMAREQPEIHATFAH